jgi:hypothetical protein
MQFKSHTAIFHVMHSQACNEILITNGVTTNAFFIAVFKNEIIEVS